VSAVNLLHDVKLGDKAPYEFNVVIENVKGSSNKIEYDREAGVFKLDRVLYSAVYWPFDYGFAPQTWHEDEDPLDVIVLTTHPTFPGCIVKVRPVALIVMEDEAGIDDKIVAVPVKDPRFNHIQDYQDIPEHVRREIQEFFETYKRLEPNKWVKFKEWKSLQDAVKKIDKAIKAYREKFGLK
jgi:inorganic pyrophosphatase